MVSLVALVMTGYYASACYTRGMTKRRVLVKISGEQLKGEESSGFDVARATWIASEIQKATNDTEIVMVVGGGNYVRGASMSNSAIGRVTADHIGMLATIMNGLALADVFNSTGLETRVLSTIKTDQIIDQFTHRRAISHLDKGRVVIIAGGIGRPYLTTDTATVSLALELRCDLIIKATKVDGVYTRDPAVYPEAKKITQLSLHDALQRPDIKVMDRAALALAADHHKAITVCALLTPGAIARACAEDPAVGTRITPKPLA